MGRVRVKYPSLDGKIEGWWARMAAPGAGNDRGQLMMPLVGDEVLVAFEHGDVQRPYVIGSLWNGKDTPGDLVHTDGSYAPPHRSSRSRSRPRRRSRSPARTRSSSRAPATSTITTNGSIKQNATGEVTIEGQTDHDQGLVDLDRGHDGQGQRHGAARMSDNLVGAGIAFPLRVDSRGGLALSRSHDDVDEAIRLIVGTAQGERPMRPEFGCGIHDYVFESIDSYTLGRIDYEIRVALDRWEPRIDVVDIDFDTSDAEQRQARDRDHLRAARHERRAQPRLSVLPHPGGVRVSIPQIELDDRRFQEPRQRGPHARRPGLPGVDRAQRLRPRHHADRAVRLDDRDARLPPQPRAGQAPPRAARAARRSRSPSPSPRPPRCASGSRRRPSSPSRSRPGRPRSARSARPATSRSCSRRATTSRSRPRARWPTSSSAPGRPRTSASQPAWPGRRAATSSPSTSRRKIGNALYLGFDASLARLLLRIDVDCSQARGAGRRPRGSAAALGGLGRGRRDRLERGDRARRPHRRLQLRLGRDRAAAALAPLAEHDRRPARLLGALPPRRRHALGRGERAASRTRPRSTRSPPARSAPSSPPRTPRATRPRCSARATARPASSFQLLYAPVLEPTPAEHLEVLDPERGEDWQAWEQRESFAESGPDDRHYVLDAADGTIELGPAVRSPDGSWRQYGRVPPARALLRMTGYRDGGGRRGNVTGGHAERAQVGDPRRRRRSRTRSARPAASTSRRSRARACARPWSCAPATAP